MKAGERYVIEIDKVYVPMKIGEDFKLARIKGFNSLVFDENGLSKLEKLEDVIQEECDRARQEGHEDAMNTTKGVIYTQGMVGLKREVDKARQEGFKSGQKMQKFDDEQTFNWVLQQRENHDGCEGCEYELCDGDPCTTCKGSYVDKYKPKGEKTEGIRKYDICKMNGNEYCVTQIYSSCGDTFLDIINKTGAVHSRVDAILFTKVGHIDSLDEWLGGE